MTEKILMSLPGPAIRLTRKDGAFGEAYKWVLPMTEEVVISASQQIYRPLEELVNYISKTARTLATEAGVNLLATLVEAPAEVAKVLGIQLVNKGFYANAWRGSNPGSLSVIVKLYRGMDGTDWDPKTSVYDISSTIMAETLPNQKGVLLAPMPNGLGIFVAYAQTYFNNNNDGNYYYTKQILDASSKTTTGDSALKPADTNTMAGTSASNSDKYSNTWYVELGYFDGKKTFTQYHQLPDCIVESSTIKWGKSVGKSKLSTTFYPVDATITLSMKMENIPVKGDFVAS
jgi:hypothetical protein